MISTISTYQVSARIQFGIGASSILEQETEKLGCEHALVVTDIGVKNARLLGGIQKSLTEAGVAITLFDPVQADPGTRTVKRCIDDYLKAGVDKNSGRQQKVLNTRRLLNPFSRLPWILPYHFLSKEFGTI